MNEATEGAHQTGPLALAVRVAELLDAMGIAYAVGGSLASSLLGEPRATADVDIAVRLGIADVDRLVAATQDEFYVSLAAARDALRRRSSFNLIHLASMLKVDLFVLGDDLLDRRQIERRHRVVVGDSPRLELWVGAPEDQVLRKLSWYRAGGEVSDRQWRDVVAILAVQAHRLDHDDLRATAETLGLGDLLALALAEAAEER